MRRFCIQLFVPQAPQSSPYRRAESDIQLAIPSTHASAEWEVVLMKRKLILIVLASMMLTGCKQYVEEDNIDKNNKTNVSSEPGDEASDNIYMSLTDIKESKDKVMQAAYDGKWSNLKFDKISPEIAEGYSEVYNIKGYDGDTYRNLDGIDLAKEQLKFIEHYADDYPDGVFRLFDFEKGTEYNDYSYEEFMALLEKGDFSYQTKGQYQITYMAKRIDELHPSAYVATFENVGVSRVDKCKISDTALEPMIESGEYTGGGIPGMNDWFLDTEKVYYANATDGSLDDKWMLLDGEMSVRECIEFVESYLKNEIPLDSKPYLEPNVYLVRVLKVTDDVYAYSCMVNRRIYGMTTEACPSSFGNSPEGVYLEMGLTEIIERNQIDTMSEINLNQEFETTGEPIEKILSLEGAFNKLSDWIGDNSSYTIHSVDLGCNILLKDWTGKPVWRIVATNNNDNRDYIFEIDCVTEKVWSRKKKVY